MTPPPVAVDATEAAAPRVDDGPAPTRRRWVLTAAAVAVIGAGGIAWASLADGQSADGPVLTTRPAAAERVSLPAAEPLPLPARAVSSGPGATPQDAIEGFVVAEAAGELETAWTWFSPSSRELWSTPRSWVAAHADELGQVTGLQLDAIEVGPDDATATGLLSRRPGLDPVSGLTAATSTFTVELVRTADGWTVDLTTLDLQPILPDEASAIAAAEQFLVDARACRPAALPLAGRASLAEQLCDLQGDIELGAVGALDDVTIIQPFLASYGGSVTSWARIVPLRGALDATLVLGPFGDGWTPIGITSAR